MENSSYIEQTNISNNDIRLNDSMEEKNNLTEYEAHRYIQKTSMDSGTNMVETAEMVIRIMMN